MRPEAIEIELDDFAIRSFRDIADYDYMAARLTYRTKLIPQFLWSSLQATEKYLKCILLLNRIPARGVRHDLSAALALIKQHAPFTLRLSASTLEFIDHLDTYGRFRYLETPFYVAGFALANLDKAVWEIRRYCTVLKYSLDFPDGTTVPMFDAEISKIERSEKYPRHSFRLSGGTLERVLDDKKHPGRGALVWQNLYFGLRRKKRVTMPKFTHMTNSPLSLHPEILDNVLKYVFLPKEVIDCANDQFMIPRR